MEILGKVEFSFKISSNHNKFAALRDKKKSLDFSKSHTHDQRILS